MAVASQPVQLLATQATIMSARMASTFLSNPSSLPTEAPDFSMASIVSSEMRSVLKMNTTDSQHTTRRMRAMGAQMMTQSRNEMVKPAFAPSMFSVMMLSAEPAGVIMPPMHEAYAMPIMSALPRLAACFAVPFFCSTSMMLDMAMPANSAVQGRFDTNAEITAVAIMNMSTVSFALPFVMCMSVNTIFVGIFVFSSADVMPNDAKMKKITLLMKFAHTPGVPLYGKMPNPGMRHMSARPEMAMGTGSVTQSTMPDTMSAMAILPA